MRIFPFIRSFHASPGAVEPKNCKRCTTGRLYFLGCLILVLLLVFLFNACHIESCPSVLMPLGIPQVLYHMQQLVNCDCTA